MSGVVGNAISLVAVIIAMMALSWQITLASLVLLPVFLAFVLVLALAVVLVIRPESPLGTPTRGGE